MRPGALVVVLSSLCYTAAHAEPTLPPRPGSAAPWSLSLQLQQPRAPGLLPPAAEPRPWQLHEALAQREADSARLTFEFHPRKAGADLRELGTLRVQLSSQGSFSLRPRRGGVQMSWKSSF